MADDLLVLDTFVVPEHGFVESFKVSGRRDVFRVPYVVDAPNGGALRVMDVEYLVPAGKHLLDLRYASYVSSIVLVGKKLKVDLVTLRDFVPADHVEYPNIKTEGGKVLSFHHGGYFD